MTSFVVAMLLGAVAMLLGAVVAMLLGAVVRALRASGRGRRLERSTEVWRALGWCAFALAFLLAGQLARC